MFRKALAVATAASLLVLAGCGSDDSGGTAFSGPKLKGDPIVIGTLGGYTGSQASSQGLIDETMKVWEDYTNTHGGVNGHPVKLIIKDEANDPAKALQAVKELIDEDHVVAIVGHASLVSATWVDYAAKKQVPVIGGVPIEATSFSNPNVFPTGANVVSMIVGQFIRMDDAGLKKMAIMYCAESPICATLPPLATAAAALVSPDLSISYDTKVSATQPSYNAECLAAKDSGADAMFPGLNASGVMALTSGCAKVGYKPINVAQMTVFGATSFANPALDKSLLVSPTFNYLDDSDDTVKTFLDAMEVSDPDILKNPQFTVNTLWAWLGGEMFKKVAEKADLGPTSTTADVYKGVYQIKDETLGGAIAPTTYVKGKPTFNSCFFEVSIEKGAPKTDKAEPTCLSAEQLTGLNKILGG